MQPRIPALGHRYRAPLVASRRCRAPRRLSPRSSARPSPECPASAAIVGAMSMLRTCSVTTPGVEPRRGDDQRHVQRRVVEEKAVIGLAVIAERFAVIGGHDDAVCRRSTAPAARRSRRRRRRLRRRTGVPGAAPRTWPAPRTADADRSSGPTETRVSASGAPTRCSRPRVTSAAGRCRSASAMVSPLCAAMRSSYLSNPWRGRSFDRG